MAAFHLKHYGIAVASMVVFAGGCSASGAGGLPESLSDSTEEHSLRNKFEVKNLVSDDAKAVPAEFTDPLLKNPWGLAAGPKTFWWVANNATQSSTLYDAEGKKQSLTVQVAGKPTGLVFNAGSTFSLASCDINATARFIFASEDGTISAWSPDAPLLSLSHVVMTNKGAIYKGLALSEDGTRLYATDFHNARVDVIGAQFKTVNLGANAFVDSALPKGYAPFGIRALNGMIFVTYAQQDDKAEDDVSGAGLGFVDAYDPNGKLLYHVASQGRLDAPWGLAIAPDDFPVFGGMLLVGNFGSGHIEAFDLKRCDQRGCHDAGELHRADGTAIEIDGLWAIDFGKGNDMTGDTDELYFTAGPNDEDNGLFGYIQSANKPAEKK